MNTLGAFRRSSSFFSNVAYFLYALSALLLFSGYLDFFAPLFGNDSLIWRLAHHGVWAVYCLAAIFFSFFFRKNRVLLTFSALSFVFICCLYVFDGGWVAKNLIKSAVTMLTVLMLALASGVDRCLRLIAILTAAFSSVVVLDTFFLDGLSTTIGRSAGFYMNPNTAAGVLIVALFSTLRVVVAPYRLPFIVIAIAAVFFTLSRSSLLVACIGIALYFASFIRAEGFRSVRASFALEIKLVSGLVAFLAIILVLALIVNPRFAMAFEGAYSGLYFVGLVIEVFGRSSFEAGAGSEGLSVLEMKSSAGARLVLLLASIDAFMSAPLLGVGLDQAHNLRPHNTFLLFLVGLGAAGLLVPLLLLVQLALGSGKGNRILVIVVFLLMVFSHDILLSSSFLVPIATSIAAAIGANKFAVEHSWAPLTARAPLTVALCLFAVLCSFFTLSVQRDLPSTFRNQLDSQSAARIEDCIYFVDPIVFDASRFYMRDVLFFPSSARFDSYRFYEDRVELRQDLQFDFEEFLNCNGRFFVNSFGAVFFTSNRINGDMLHGEDYVLEMPLVMHPMLYIFNIFVVLAALVSVARIWFRRSVFGGSV